jgi:hypothetical protein
MERERAPKAKIRIKTKPAGQMALEGMELIETPPRKQPPVDEAFGVFWQAYPRKLDRYQARQVWDKLMKEPGIRVEDILRGLRAQLPFYANLGPFVPYPATWLRHRRWLDRVEDIAPREAGQAELLYRAIIDRYLREGKI